MSEEQDMTQVDRSVVEGAAGEMAYKQYQSQFGGERNVAIPCQLRFTEKPVQDTELFHDVLAQYGFQPLDVDPDRKADQRQYYEGEILSEDYRRLRIVVFRGNVVRLFPREDGLTTHQLADVIYALEKGFNAPLEHDPIDD